MKVLVVEDDATLRLGLTRALHSQGFEVDEADSGEAAIAATDEFHYDAAVLDIGLPNIDGLRVLRYWRENGVDHGVLVLTATDDVPRRIQALNQGADDFMPKPFDPDELIARLRAIVRRRSGVGAVLKFSELSFNTETRELKQGDTRILLSPREAALIELLISKPGQVVSKARIVSSMSSWEANFSANSVEIYVLKLRRKLAPYGVSIMTVRGAGYALEAGLG